MDMVEEVTQKWQLPKRSRKRFTRYNTRSSVRIGITIPKGQKATVQAAAEQEGESINSYTNKALLARMGLTAWPEAKEGGADEP